MKIAILGDVHGNLEALDAVCAVAREKGVNTWIQLGDVVGYGPDPEVCIERVQELEALVVAGNHDWAVSGRIDADTFNPIAREAVTWTRDRLSETQLDWLDSLPLVATHESGVTCVHGALHEPEEFHYVQDLATAWRELQILGSGIAFNGHSHVPVIHALAPDLVRSERRVLDLAPTQAALINPGSVGQPRDGIPEAAFGILDLEQQRYELFRVPYPIDETAAKIRDRGLPGWLADRLYEGS